MKSSRKMLLLVAFLVFSSSSTASDIDVNALRAELREANTNNDGARMTAAAGMLLAEFAGHPAYLYYAARGAALSDDKETSLRILEDIATRGVDMLDPVLRDTAFETVRALPGFTRLQEHVANLNGPTGKADIAFSFGEPATQPEAVAMDDKGRVFIGSVRQGHIVVRDTNGAVEKWAVPESWSVQAMHFSPNEKQLWAGISAMNVSKAANAADRGRSALVAFDSDSGEVVSLHELKTEGEHVLGDFLFLDETTILATDSIGGGVWNLDVQSGTYSKAIASGVLRSPQGLARLGSYVIIADYSNGLYRYDPGNGGVLRIKDGPASPYGIDGVYVYDNAVIAIQNGVKPRQVTRYELSGDMQRIVSREILLAGHAAFGEPTLGTVTNEKLYFVANSLWNHVTAEGDIPATHFAVPVILSLGLSRIKRHDHDD